MLIDFSTKHLTIFQINENIKNFKLLKITKFCLEIGEKLWNLRMRNLWSAWINTSVTLHRKEHYADHYERLIFRSSICILSSVKRWMFCNTHGMNITIGLQIAYRYWFNQFSLYLSLLLSLYYVVLLFRVIIYKLGLYKRDVTCGSYKYHSH